MFCMFNSADQDCQDIGRNLSICIQDSAVPHSWRCHRGPAQTEPPHCPRLACHRPSRWPGSSEGCWKPAGGTH